MTAYRFWADAVVVFHAAYAGFVALGMVAILLGIVLHWQWIRNFWFRAIHVLMIGIVVAESLCDISCPLTTLEKELRDQAGEAVYAGSFIGYWVHELLFYNVPNWVATLCYSVFGLMVLGALILAPPRWPRLPWHTKTNPGKDA